MTLKHLELELLLQVSKYLRSEYAAAQETLNEQCGPHQLASIKLSYPIAQKGGYRRRKEATGAEREATGGIYTSCGVLMQVILGLLG